jgi:tetratricopeptide (TPR) repeat protein
MPCGHRFCRGCVDSIFETGSTPLDENGHAPCPLCRAPMPGTLSPDHAPHAPCPLCSTPLVLRSPSHPHPPPADVEELVEQACDELAVFEKWQRKQKPGNWQEGALARVANICEQALAIDPAHPRVHRELAYARQYHGDILCDPQERRARFVLAEASFAAATAADPSNADTLYNLAILRDRRLGDEARAEEAYRACLALQPSFAAAHVNLGGILMQKSPKDVDGAEAEFRAAIASKPGLANAHLALGMLLEEERQNIEGAVASYRGALKVHPQHTAAQKKLASLLPALRKLQRKNKKEGKKEKAKAGCH